MLNQLTDPLSRLLFRRITNPISRLLQRPKEAAAQYHQWYFNTSVHRSTLWLGTPVQKSVSDMWNYQEILFALKPSLVLEFGTAAGGSALFFATVMRQLRKPFRVLTVDIGNAKIPEDPDIELMAHCSSLDPEVSSRIAQLKIKYQGPIFAILDSDHAKAHVLGEMLMLRPLLSSGDYMIVEDSNINGHPVLPLWGEGPYEAIEEYMRRFPSDYFWDRERENKFGFTFAPHGFLVRR